MALPEYSLISDHVTPCFCVYLPLRVIVCVLTVALPSHSLIFHCDAMCLRVSSSS